MSFVPSVVSACGSAEGAGVPSAAPVSREVLEELALVRAAQDNSSLPVSLAEAASTALGELASRGASWLSSGLRGAEGISSMGLNASVTVGVLAVVSKVVASK